ncbi:protein shisa-5 isoform X1 [Bubalus kerabau]|uniref:protein shisa-5 isoform X1 n=2 Tax=Bubalus carabanensis TaxID=3119969 RepID=UPI00042CCC5F|nr:protein shisa-5 isoform X1 [Bubalus carabanensis]
MAAPAPAPRILVLLLLLLPAPEGAQSELCMISHGRKVDPWVCPDFCCGNCNDQYCCSDVLKQVMWIEEDCHAPEASILTEFDSSFDSEPVARFGTVIAIGVTLFVIAVVTVIVCCTCSCCCLYKMCRRPQPVVTTTVATTVTHTPYLQPPSYPGPTYQGYHSVVPQPGMPTAPYPTQPMGPPAYHETMAGGAALPYPASQPPYNPAYMEPPKAVP